MKRLSVTTRWLFIFGMALNLLLMINGLLRNILLNPEKFISNLPLYLEMKLYIWYVLFYSVLFGFQLRFYLRFVRQALRGAEKLDTALFNDSFQLLNKGNVMAIIHISLSMLIGSLEVWTSFNQARKILHH